MFITRLVSRVIVEQLDALRLVERVVTDVVQEFVADPPADAPVEPAYTGPAVDVDEVENMTEEERDAAILAAADDISARAMNGETSFSENDYLIMFEAAEILTGVPSSITRAYAFGEGLGTYYVEPYPRQFVLPGEAIQSTSGLTIEAEQRLSGENGWATISIDGVQIPVAIGDDFRAGGLHTYGLGIMQLTFTENDLLGVPGLTITRNGELVPGEGYPNNGFIFPGLNNSRPIVPDSRLPVPMANVDVERLMRDPYYNIVMFSQFVLHNIQQGYANNGNYAAMPAPEEATADSPFGTILVAWPGLPEVTPGVYDEAWYTWAHWIGQLKGGSGGNNDYVEMFRSMEENTAEQLQNGAAYGGLAYDFVNGVAVVP
jgi:hypothetical protein